MEQSHFPSFEAQVNQVFGWRQGSKMPSIYVHLLDRDVDDALLGVYGLRKAEEKEPAQAQTRVVQAWEEGHGYKPLSKAELWIVEQGSSLIVERPSISLAEAALETLPIVPATLKNLEQASSLGKRFKSLIKQH